MIRLSPSQSFQARFSRRSQRPRSFRSALAVSLCVFFLVVSGCQSRDPASDSAVPSGSSPVPLARDHRETASPSPPEASTPSQEVKDPRSEISESADRPAPPRDIASDPERGKKLVAEAASSQEKADYAQAAQLYQDAMQADPENPQIPYLGAVNYAKWGDQDLALESLAVAADMGYADTSAVATENAFDPLRQNPAFHEVMERVENNR